MEAMEDPLYYDRPPTGRTRARRARNRFGGSGQRSPRDAWRLRWACRIPRSSPGGCLSTPGGASITGTVAGTVIVAVGSSNAEVARVTAAGSPKSFSLSVPAGASYRLYLIENEGTAGETVFPLYQGSTNVFAIASAVTIDLGFVDTSSGRANPANSPLAVAGVTSAGEDATVPPCLVAATNYFPLQVGNKWIYAIDGAHYRTDEIMGTERVQNSLTYLLERLDPPYWDSYHEKRWMAYGAEDALVLKIWGNEGQGSQDGAELSPAWVHMKLSPKLGDAWTLEATDPGGVVLYHADMEIVSVDQTITVPAGTFTGCVGLHKADDDHVDYYAPGVGLVLHANAVEPVDVAQLVYAKVGAQTYGVAP